MSDWYCSLCGKIVPAGKVKGQMQMPLCCDCWKKHKKDYEKIILRKK